MLHFIGSYTGVEFLIVSIAFILCIVLSLTFHEFAHAFIAYKMGDVNVKIQGRLTINPLKHIDPIGFLCCALFGFGWARPVQINSSNFRNIKKGIVWTSLAGVITNLLLSFVFCGVFKLTLLMTTDNILIRFLQYFTYYFAIINISLAVFNLLPIYPLDGFKFVEGISKYNNPYVNFMYRYGTLVLLIVLLFFDFALFNLIKLAFIPIESFWNLLF